jgi:hypothetical protein
MESDLFMSSMGIKALQVDNIYSDRLSAMWQYKFLGQDAPVGFKYYLGL